MTNRYVSKADAAYRPADECRLVARTGIEVHEVDACDSPTGLLDAMGRPLFRVAERRPIGFVHFGDAE